MPSQSANEIQAADRYFTSREVGQILQVNASSVVKWINDGILSAFRTPGGHRRVPASELIRFARQHGMPIPEQLRELAVSRVLVVDEEPRFLSALQRALKPYDREFSVEVIDNGIDALILAGANKPDFLILDIGSPGIDGLEVLERLRSHPETRSITLIATGSRMDETAASRCRKLGVATCLTKPVRVADLVDTLRELRKPRQPVAR